LIMTTNKNNKKQSAARKLIPAIGMLTVSAMMLSSSTYAWFTMNKTVTVTGMTMKTKVSENLLIADDTIDSTAVKADNLFNNSLVQLVDGLIEPVSTVNGKNFFYTAGTNVQGNGAVLNKTWAQYDPSDTSDFASAYALSGGDATAAKGYVDYVYQLKAINGSTASEIRLTGLNLTYGGTGDNGQKATRIAVFAENLGYKTGAAPSANLIASKGTVDDAAVVLKAIYTPSSAANFSFAEGTLTTVSTDDATGVTGYDAVSATNARADVVYNAPFVLPVGDSQTQYYKIVVRVWLEGEDTTCNNTTFMDLRDKWSVDMKWDFVATSDATKTKVTNIASAVSTGKIALTTSQTVAGTAAYTISGTPYYALTGKTLDDKQLYIRETSLATTSQVFTISTDGLYPTNVTNQVTITAGT
jgi:hypothetical protein